MFKEKAKNIIYQAITQHGILASAEKKDNYNRVWSRDAMMTGIVGIYLKDSKIIEAHKNSILTLSENQSETGALPSNVEITERKTKVSYGSLVGRVDATTWWIIGTCSYLEFTQDQDLKQELLPKIEKALQCLKTWEFNNRGLIYTPIGGNWADEYITTGYTLYDNVLRYWAIHCFSKLYENIELQLQAKALKLLIENNFYKKNTEIKNEKYHINAYKKAEIKPYFYASLSANGYDERFDLAGNALAILLDFSLDLSIFELFLNQLNKEFKHWMIPVFYPIIFPNDDDWKLLEQNYNYDFKNQPFHFHNGASWPIFLGWLSLALNKKGSKNIAEKILFNYEDVLKKQNNPFNEYYTTDQLLPKGTENLCFSAAGYLLMKL